MGQGLVRLGIKQGFGESEDMPPVFSSSPPRFVKTLKMLTTELFLITLLGGLYRPPENPAASPSY